MSPIEPRFTGERRLPGRIMHWAYRKCYEEPRRAALRREFMARGVDWSRLTPGRHEVHTLLCHRDIEMGVCAAMSLALAAGETFDWRIHDDGSLTDADAERILAHVPVAKVIRRSEADARAAEECRHFPGILEYRRRQVMALKLVDVRLWSSTGRIAYVDSDICFVSRPDFFMEALRGSRPGAYFNKDVQDSYVMSAEDIAARIGVRPFGRANAGLWVMDTAVIDLPTIESWLQHPGLSASRSAYTLDQTMISMLAAGSGRGVAHLPDAYDVDLRKPLAGAVTKHYVGAIRHGYELEGLRRLLNPVQQS